MTGIEQLEDQKVELLAALTGWSQARLLHRPSAGEWCALEMLDHLVKVEVGILKTAKRGLRAPHRIGFTDRLRTRFLNGVFRSERKVKVPASASQVLPGSNLALPAIIERWDQCRAELAQMLMTETAERLKKGLFKHPVGGWMGMPEILEFFSVHLIHHGYQLARLRESSEELVTKSRDY